MTLAQLRRALHRTERGLGDVQAARRGPDVLAARLARREAWRLLFRAIR